MPLMKLCKAFLWSLGWTVLWVVGMVGFVDGLNWIESKYGFMAVVKLGGLVIFLFTLGTVTHLRYITMKNRADH
jgi:hypothetical protein